MDIFNGPTLEMPKEGEFERLTKIGKIRLCGFMEGANQKIGIVSILDNFMNELFRNYLHLLSSISTVTGVEHNGSLAPGVYPP